jgi:hypothetical protein
VSLSSAVFPRIGAGVGGLDGIQTGVNKPVCYIKSKTV